MVDNPEKGSSTGEDRCWGRGIWIVLAVAAFLRIILVFSGGQFGQIDEARYLDSRAAAAELAHGDWRKGIALPLEKGDHVGFKVIGLVPALIEQVVGSRDWIPGLFFASFSVAAIALLGGIAGRLGGTRREQFWAVFAAASSGALFYFARHLLPYDAALAFMLGSLYLALAPGFRWWRLLLAGIAAGAGFVTYYGYWTLAGFILAMGAVCGTPDRSAAYWSGFAKRAALLAAGFAAAVALPVAVNKGLGSGQMIAGARALSGSITTGDFRGQWVPWEYLWLTDRLELPLALLFTGWGLACAWKRPDVPAADRWRRPEAINAFCLLGIWLSFVVTGTVLHKFAVHDRLVRQLLPFLILGLAFGVEAWIRQAPSENSRRFRSGLLILVIGANALAAFATPIAQEFPRDFKRRGDALLAARGDAASPDYYFRYVNVTQYFLEAETLQAQPLETLLAAPHPFQYRPYLYEAKTPQDRAHRESVDHRMRLVKMPVIPNERIRGDPYGIVTMRLRLPRGRGAFIEPLLSLGNRNDGDVFFIHYFSDSKVALGYFSTGERVYESEPMAVVPGALHTVDMFSGDLIPPGRSAADDEHRMTATIKFDGKSVLQTDVSPKPSKPEEVYAGVRTIMVDYTLAQFSGEILNVARKDDLRSLPAEAGQWLPSDPTAVRMTLLPGAGPVDAPEPLVVAGKPGRAVLVYLRRLADGKVRVGCELWGIGAWESDPLPSLAPSPDTLVCELGPLFPEPGSRTWGQRGLPDQMHLKQSVVLQWNGERVLDHPVPAVSLEGGFAHYGTNPVGGSTVGPHFGGTIEKVEMLPLEKPQGGAESPPIPR